MTRRSRLRAVAAFLAGCLAGVLVLELGLRTIKATPLWRVLPVVEPVLGQPDRDTGYAFTPGASGIWIRENRAPVSINALGLRDDDRMTAAKPPGTLRVALLGDSYAEALQVEHRDTFEALAERRLAARGLAVEIANLAMSGNGPLRQLVRLEKVGLPLDPDMVVSITSALDFLSTELLDDSMNPGYVTGADGRLVRGYGFRQRRAIQVMDTAAGRAAMRVIQESEVARLLYLRGREPLASLLGLPSPPRPRTVPAPPAPCTSPQLQQLSGLWLGHQPAAHWRATTTVLDEFAAHAQRRGMPVVLALTGIPLATDDCPGLAASREALVAAIRSTLGARGLGFVDLATAVTVPYATLVGFGSVRSGHFNHLGHRVHADALADIITAHLAPGLSAAR